MMPFGKHIMAELTGCRRDCLDDLGKIEQTMVEAALLAGAEVREVAFHKFAPQGVSGVVIISESHLAIHTFPEFGYASLDIYTCGDLINPHLAFQYLCTHLKAATCYIKELHRGPDGFREPVNRELVLVK